MVQRLEVPGCTFSDERALAWVLQKGRSSSGRETESSGQRELCVQRPESVRADTAFGQSTDQEPGVKGGE